jgi:ABC-type branched-subunit amino acid transport system substrate-binding protein
MGMADLRRSGLLAACAFVTACGADTSAPAGSAGGPTPYKVGFVLALSGTGSVYADPAQQGMQLAIEHINKENLAGRPLEIVVVDDATDPRVAADACNRLVMQEKVDAIIGYESTPARVACNQAAQRAQIPYIASSNSGGDLCLPNMYQVGTVPNQQIDGLVDYLIQIGKRKFYLFGSDYSSPKASFARAQEYIASKQATVVGTTYEPLGTADFSADIARIAAAKPDVVIAALVGADAVPFHKQVATDPRTSGITLSSFELKASTARAIGPQVNGVVMTSDYFVTIDTPANAAFIAAMKQKFGDKADPSESAVLPHDAAHLLAGAVKAAPSVNGPDVIKALSTSSIDGPRGTIAFGGGARYATFDMFVAAVRDEGRNFEILKTVPRVVPVVPCGN